MIPINKRFCCTYYKHYCKFYFLEIFTFSQITKKLIGQIYDFIISHTTESF